jgi:hypothetical protein
MTFGYTVVTGPASKARVQHHVQENQGKKIRDRINQLGEDGDKWLDEYGGVARKAAEAVDLDVARADLVYRRPHSQSATSRDSELSVKTEIAGVRPRRLPAAKEVQVVVKRMIHKGSHPVMSPGIGAATTCHSIMLGQRSAVQVGTEGRAEPLQQNRIGVPPLLPNLRTDDACRPARFLVPLLRASLRAVNIRRSDLHDVRRCEAERFWPPRIHARLRSTIDHVISDACRKVTQREEEASAFGGPGGAVTRERIFPALLKKVISTSPPAIKTVFICWLPTSFRWHARGTPPRAGALQLTRPRSFLHIHQCVPKPVQ